MRFFKNLFRRKEFLGHPYSQTKPSRHPGLFGIRRKDPTRAEVQICRGRTKLMDENNRPVTRSISLNFESGEYSRDIEKLIVEAKMVLCLAESGAWDPDYFRSFVCRNLVREKVQIQVHKRMDYLDPESPLVYHAICQRWRTGGPFKIDARWA